MSQQDPKSTSPDRRVDQPKEAPYWPALAAAGLLGSTLLATFLLSGHGLGATGFTTRLSAWLWNAPFPESAQANEYLGKMAANPAVLDNWITYQVIGVLFGALVSAHFAGRLTWRLATISKGQSRKSRLITAFVGGIFAGFGARVALGCTSGMGLSGAAVLSTAAFVFLGAFFGGAILLNRILWRR